MPPGTERAGRRLALIVATSVYEDETLRRLRAPAQDASELAAVLADPRVGHFEVIQILDSTRRDIEIAIDDFLSHRDPEDALLLYLSCHGLLDARSRLYFAARDTIKDKLAATALDAPKLKRQLEESRARQQLIVLDCCFSGAFLRNKGETDRLARPVELNRLQSDGRGQAILTASRATEYSLEGEPIDESTMAASIFTSTLVAGLRTGEADVDNDGLISAEDAYKYTFRRLKAAKAHQTPLYGTPQTEGVIYFGHSVAGIRDLSAAPPTAVPEAENRTGPSVPTAARTGALRDLWLLDAVANLMEPQGLRQAALARSVEEAVAIMAAGRAVGREDKVDELLAMAAQFRPAEEVVQLIALVRAAGHPNDADQLLAAAGSRRPAAELASLAVVIGQSGEEEDVVAVLAVAGRTRSASEVLDLAFELREVGRPADADRTLAATAGTRSAKEAAEAIRLARRNGTDDDAVAILLAFRQRPVPEVARLVGALRELGDQDMAMYALGVIEELDGEKITALATELRRNPDGNVDADHVLRWPAMRRAPDDVATLISLLAEAKRREDATVVAEAAGRSRPAADLAAIVLTLGSAIADEVLRHAALRPPRVVGDLFGLLAPPATKKMMTPEELKVRDNRSHRRTLLAQHVMSRPPVEAMAVLDAAPADGRTELISAAATAPADQILRLLPELAARNRSKELVGQVARGSPRALAAFMLALPGSAYADLLPELTTGLLGRDPKDIVEAAIAFTSGGHEVSGENLVRAAEERHPGHIQKEYVARLPSSRLAVQLRTAQEAKEKEQRDKLAAEELAKTRRARRIRRWQLSGAGLLDVVTFGVAASLGAALSRLLAKPPLNIGDWFALVPTFFVVLIVLVGLGVALMALLGLVDDEAASIIMVGAALVGAVAGFALSFFVVPVADVGLVVRGWLAWNF